MGNFCNIICSCFSSLEKFHIFIFSFTSKSFYSRLDKIQSRHFAVRSTNSFWSTNQRTWLDNVKWKNNRSRIKFCQFLTLSTIFNRKKTKFISISRTCVSARREKRVHQLKLFDISFKMFWQIEGKKTERTHTHIDSHMRHDVERNEQIGYQVRLCKSQINSFALNRIQSYLF